MSTEPPTPPRRRLTTVIVLTLVGIFLVAVLRYRPPQDEAMVSLAEFVLERGKIGLVPPEALKYFGVPSDQWAFRELKAKSESGRLRAVQVRRHGDSGATDIFFLDFLPNDTRGYFYLTSTHGRLVKAAFFDTKPEAIPDAAERFATEKDFWQHWQREKKKWESGGSL
jgi:hypothetical protein